MCVHISVRLDYVKFRTCGSDDYVNYGTFHMPTSRQGVSQRRECEIQARYAVASHDVEGRDGCVESTQLKGRESPATNHETGRSAKTMATETWRVAVESPRCDRRVAAGGDKGSGHTAPHNARDVCMSMRDAAHECVRLCVGRGRRCDQLAAQSAQHTVRGGAGWVGN